MNDDDFFDAIFAAVPRDRDAITDFALDVLLDPPPTPGPMTDADFDAIFAAERKATDDLLAWLDDEPARMDALIAEIKAADDRLDAEIAEMLADDDRRLADLLDAITNGDAGITVLLDARKPAEPARNRRARRKPTL